MSHPSTSASLLHPSLMARRPELARAFREAKPFPHVVIDDFFDPALCERLLAEFPRFEDRFALNEMGEVGGKAVRTHVREISPAYRTVDECIQGSPFLSLVSEITGIPNLLYDADYIGGGTHDNRHGQSLDPHVDFNYHPKTKHHRRLNLIVYLNHEWQESWGGALELQSNPWDERTNTSKMVMPLFNRAVIFETSEVSWHGFRQIQLPPDRRQVSRKSFAVYLYTVDRPAEQTAPSHATVYVPDVRPPEIQAGLTLTPAHVQALDVRFRNLRGQLKFLYDREKHFAQQIDNLARLLNEAQAQERLPLQGFAVQTDERHGMWRDQWCGERVLFTLQPTRPARNLSLTVFVPSQMAGAQTLSITIGSQVTKYQVAPGERRTLDLPCRLAAGATVRLMIDAAKTWTPSASSTSTDDRALAFHLDAAVLDHG